MVIAAWLYFSRPQPGTAVALVGSLFALCLVNLNAWALLALPIVWLASRSDLSIPRLRWAFWLFYPVHLVAFAVVAVLVP
ncbi:MULTISPECIES: TraX family protein [unclassified Lysobacter]